MDLTKFTDFSQKKSLEKYSSAFTLSDMEIFIFPDLFYPLVLANILSPILWAWRDDPWFSDIENKGFNYRVNRVKQYIIQNYIFNLDLSTWGLTSKTAEINRFKDFFDMETLKHSNALFGYEGDKYYFDIDIRKHFGLDKYNSDIIPYWKTETIEAMTAFRYRETFSTGAGECVSLSALYAAAMFVVGRIPLEKIFLMATPLHSQNFILEKEGLITNNRRIVTKTMWYNGTSLSEKARRALENEKVTIVSHISGYIHTVYPDATIGKEAYKRFTLKLKNFLRSDLTKTIFINFLRFKAKYKSLFQYACDCSGIKRYIPVEKIFEYEHTSRFNASHSKRELLVKEIEGDEFHLSIIPGKLILNDVEKIIDSNPYASLKEIEKKVAGLNGQVPGKVINEMFKELELFISTSPRLPDGSRNFRISPVPDISISDSRETIFGKILKLAPSSEAMLLVMYVFRQMDLIDWRPFLKAAIERNPVCFIDLKGRSVTEGFDIIKGLSEESIYGGPRLALPDEVWNFHRGDGIEKAILLADFIKSKDPESDLEIQVNNKDVDLNYKGNTFHFISRKGLRKSIKITGNNYLIN